MSTFTETISQAPVDNHGLASNHSLTSHNVSDDDPGAFTGLSFGFQVDDGFGNLNDAGFGCCASSPFDFMYSATVEFTADINTRFRAVLRNPGFTTLGGFIAFKTLSLGAAANPGFASNITNNSVDLTFNNFLVNTNQSLATAIIEIRLFGTIPWFQVGTPLTGQSGYGFISMTRSISGLAGSTPYEFRLHIVRTTVNDTDYATAPIIFTTLADAPTIATAPASNISIGQAQLNGVVNPNNLQVRVRFGWGTVDAGAGTWANYTAYITGTSNVDTPFSDTILGLAASTTFFFRALVEYPGPAFNLLLQGATLSFVTPANPVATAAQEDHMHVYQYDGITSVASTFFFTLSSPSATSSDRLVTTAPASLFAVGDIKVSIDGGVPANVTNAVVQVLAGYPLYSLTLTAAEMAGTQIVVAIVDLNGPAFRDAFLFIRTRFKIGQIESNSAAIGSSTPAMILKPATGGYSLDMQDSAGSVGIFRGFHESMVIRAGTALGGGAGTIDLDAGAQATDDYYNGAIIVLPMNGGTGSGQSRIISDYTSASKRVFVNRSWSANPASGTKFVILTNPETWGTSPNAELAALPTFTSSYGAFLQFLFQRFAYIRSQTTSTFKMGHSADDETAMNALPFAHGTVNDDGSRQLAGKLING